ncbi:RINT-1 / TIP-1 family [Teratosphaeria destructans]|uniref:RINT-1 / TIP-1 family n=1 Tax=Teratosphaeria destructans TaxID=418781 RepID=A0A9W7SMC2_9PEZI|nr:RINT-1 / TIP-1 family [Teratosphaeria destructans]
MDVRVQDYLDDRLQNSADLETLNILLENVKNQQQLLKQQLDDAKRDHSAAEQEAERHAHAVRQKARGFQKEQSDIDRRLLTVTQSETSDQAVAKFEASMERLRQLDVAAGYVELLKEVDSLRMQSTSQLGKSDEAALEPYRRLQHLVASLQPLQQAAEGAAPHLLDHIVRQLQALRDTIRKSFASDLEKTLENIGWPKPFETVPLALEKAWTRNVSRLLELQKPELEDWEHDISQRSPGADPPALLPVEVLIKPLEQRFIYHFSGKRPSNRLDKPEWFFQHTLDLLETYSSFIENALQPLLIQRFRGTDLALTPACIDGASAFITALLPMLRHKLGSFASQVDGDAQLLSHLVHEVNNFDATLQNTYAYAPNSPTQSWRGLAHYLLDTQGYFQKWLTVERDFAIARYQNIVEDPNAGELDYDYVSANATKPTKMAIRVNDLLETITDRYKPLSSFGHKLRFLMDVQIHIFDMFHRRLHSALEAYLSMTSSVGRTMQGMTREQQADLQGRKGLDRLCRVFGSAEYMERAMRDWSDDVFFVELWEELQDRAQTRDNISNKLGGLQEIQQKTSSAVGGEDSDGELQGALFDETAASYHKLRVRSESIIVETLTYNIREALRPYGRIGTWASLSTGSAGGSVSSEIVPLLDLLKEYFGFLNQAVGRLPLRRMCRQVCHSIQAYIWDSVLIRHNFSTAGAMQLASDVRSICSEIDSYMGTGQAQAGMRKLLEGVTLIGLPVKGEIQRVQPSRAGEDADDDAAWDEPDGEECAGQSKQMGLFEVERLVFMDNESARHALEQMGLELLSENDARAVLSQRVEIGS